MTAETRGAATAPPERPPEAPQEIADQIAQVLHQTGQALPPDVEVESVGYSSWQGFMKDSDGGLVEVPLHSTRVVVRPKARPKQNREPFKLSDYISQADPVIIPPVGVKAVEDDPDIERLLIIPDMQVGFRRYEDGALEPTHCEEAIDVMLQIIRETQPDQIILNGDNLDFPTLSKYEQEQFLKNNTLKPSINYLYRVLTQMRALAPNAKIVYLAGNHEQRLEHFIMTRAPELYDMTQAESEDRLLSIPFILRLGELGIKYYSGYPENAYLVSGRAKITHGKVAKSATSTVAGLARNGRMSDFPGHTHRVEVAAVTQEDIRRGKLVGKFVVAASFGTLADIRGRLPGTNSAVDHHGKPLTKIQNWQNAMGYVELYRATGEVAAVEPILISTFNEQRPFATRFNRKTYLPNREVVPIAYQRAAKKVRKSQKRAA